MKNNFIKINLFHAFYIIVLLFIYLILCSKSENSNPVNLQNIRKLQKYPRYEDYDDIFFKCEILREKIKNLENNVIVLIKKNQDYNLKIKIYLIYIKILYFLIGVFLLAIIIIIILKFYFQCQKRPNNNEINIERKNEIHN